MVVERTFSTNNINLLGVGCDGLLVSVVLGDKRLDHFLVARGQDKLAECRLLILVRNLLCQQIVVPELAVFAL